MAIVRRLEQVVLHTNAYHSEAEATYSIVRDDDGQRYLQIDTYGSANRTMPGKKSQSIRLAPEALIELRQILTKHFKL